MGGNSSSSMASEAPVILAATAKHTASVIFLHGLGDTGHGWASTLQTIKSPHVKCICPTAPTMPVTLNAGFRMPSWFDLRSLDPSGPEDEEGIKRACDSVHAMIDEEEKNGIPSNRIVIGGFSQGGALALYSALHRPSSLAGIISLSCWLPLHKQFPEAAVGNTDTPVLQCHGQQDPIVPFKWGVKTSEVLKTFMSNTEFKMYKSLAHSSCNEEVADMKVFIDGCIPPL